MALEEITLKISGMTCGHCERTVSESLKQMDGMIHAVVDHRTGTAAIRFDNSKLNEDQIRAAVNEDGIYRVEEVIRS